VHKYGAYKIPSDYNLLFDISGNQMSERIGNVSQVNLLKGVVGAAAAAEGRQSRHNDNKCVQKSSAFLSVRRAA
jgi:hypothetical protein